MRIGQEAKLNEMPDSELQAIAEGAKTEAAQALAAMPQQLVEVVHELNPQERQALTEQLVEVEVVSREQAATLEATVQPGGYADRLHTLLRLGSLLSEYRLVISAVPLAALILSFVLGLFSCDLPLQGWLRVTAFQWLGMCCGIFAMSYLLAPGIQKLRADPMGVVQRFTQAAVPADSSFLNALEVQLREAVPELAWRNVQFSAVLLICLILLLLLSFISGFVAVWRLVEIVFLSCNLVVSLTTAAFMLLHIGLLVGVVALVLQLQRGATPPLRHEQQAPSGEVRVELAAPTERAP